MTSSDRVPAELDCSHLGKQWPSWKRTFLMYMMATGKNEESETKKIATFLWLIGPAAMEIYTTLFPNDGTTDGILGNQNAVAPGNEQAGEGDNQAEERQSRTLEEIIIAFDRYCIPKKNVTMETFKFNQILQKEKQSFTDFETEIRKQIQFCEFGCACGVSYEEKMIKDRIIIGVYDKKLQLKLLDGRDESLQNVISVCKASEAANANKVLLDRGAIAQKAYSVEQQQISAINRRCYNCGDDFTPSHLRSCKANGVTCRCCGKQGHYQRLCKSKGKQGELTGYHKENKKPDNYNKGKPSVHSLQYWGDSSE
ncbi:uncharacterized protein LOC129954124 [Eupeodes corollae]|uniref:uncharacterized protein LOC129954124 n=1 Tax=Eupeodes corollae TaxID=290404 RepID=UPI00249166E0|nr:uncharacterized protein LOC129954124 [Eupeodes corollae]